MPKQTCVPHVLHGFVEVMKVNRKPGERIWSAKIDVEALEQLVKEAVDGELFATASTENLAEKAIFSLVGLTMEPLTAKMRATRERKELTAWRESQKNQEDSPKDA